MLQYLSKFKVVFTVLWFRSIPFMKSVCRFLDLVIFFSWDWSSAHTRTHTHTHTHAHARTRTHTHTLARWYNCQCRGPFNGRLQAIKKWHLSSFWTQTFQNMFDENFLSYHSEKGTWKQLNKHGKFLDSLFFLGLGTIIVTSLIS